MPNSMNEEQDQRKNTNMEDSTMTVDFLRARLLSERSVSKSARQRADELAKRVVELEEQLKIVSLQRKKAEKATADVLAILETNGITDVSDEEYDSRSDQEGSLCESKLDNNSVEEDEASPPNEKVGRNDSELFSGESSPLTGRSLSWKSGKNSSHSIEKKRYPGSSRRRRSSFASNGSSSSRRAGKSCRQIRCRETRSAIEELQIDTGVLALQGNEEATCSECFPNCSDTGADTSRVGSEDCEEKDLLDNQRMTDSHYFNGHEGDKDMERALEHQEQLIGQYQSEEKAQREWEEKFREDNSCTPDSCDAGNDSDVTEERDENKASAPPSVTATITFDNKINASPADVHFSKEPEIPNGSSMVANESPVPEFAFSMAKDNHDGSLHSSHNTPHVSSRVDSSLHKGEEASGSMNELALVPRETSGKLESVLEALQQAKLSLKQNLTRQPLLEGGSTSRAIQPSVSSVRPGGRLEENPVERGSLNGLFRVPTDFQFEATARANPLGPGFCSSLANYSTEPAHDKFFSGSYLESNLNTYTGDRFLSVPSFPYTEIRSGGPTRTPVFDPGLDMGLPSSGRYPYLEPQLTTSLPSRFDQRSDVGVPSSSRYPYLDPRLSTTLPSSRFDPGLDLGVPSSSRYPYPDPRLSTGTGIPSSSSYAYNTTHSFNKEMMPRAASDDRLLRPHTGRDSGMPSAAQFSFNDRDSGMPPAAQFSFYDHNNPNTYR